MAADEFEFRDMNGSTFWGVELRDATFRDVDLTGASIRGRLVDVDVDGHVDRLTVNGVDVTDYVNEHDPWAPVRTALRAPDVARIREGWTLLEREWEETIAAASRLTEAQQRASVGGEWSFVQTLRHLVFANDKWFGLPILGDEGMHPIGLPNSGSVDFGWPGLDRSADPGLDEVLAVRRQRSARFREHLDGLPDADLDRHVDVLENGSNPVRECLHVVLEEEFEHLRYARRDLAALA
jgi:hypothetical protein